jgi:integrase
MVKQGIVPTVENVTRKVTADYRQFLIDQNVDVRTAGKYIVGNSQLFRWLAAKTLVPEDCQPWKDRGFPKTRKPASERDRHFSNEEVIKLLGGAVQDDDALMSDLLRVGLLSGMRLSEIHALQVKDILDSTEGYAGLTFDVAGSIVGKTKSAPRQIPVHDDLVPIIRRRVAGKNATTKLFNEYEKSDALGKAFARFRVKQGVDETIAGVRRSRVNFHSTRRWFIRQCERVKVPQNAIGRIEGHVGKIGFTYDRYSIGEVEELRGEVNRVKLPEFAAM